MAGGTHREGVGGRAEQESRAENEARCLLGQNEVGVRASELATGPRAKQQKENWGPEGPHGAPGPRGNPRRGWKGEAGRCSRPPSRCSECGRYSWVLPIGLDSPLKNF